MLVWDYVDNIEAVIWDNILVEFLSILIFRRNIRMTFLGLIFRLKSPELKTQPLISDYGFSWLGFLIIDHKSMNYFIGSVILELLKNSI